MRRPAGEEAASPDRLLSLDAYRGFTMLAMASGGMGLAAVAKRNSAWRFLADQFEHRTWEGCTFWDLIQPSFMFIVGVSMVFSYAARQAKGQSWPRQAVHAIKRAGLLCLIGMFLDWYADSRGIYVQFIRVLQQIAIGYLISFAVLPLGPKVQGVTAVLLLVGHTAAFLVFGQVGGFDPWDMNQNVGRQIDQWLDRSFGVPMSRGFYVTFNAVSSAATILLGVLTGELLRSPASHGRKIGVLVVAGGIGLLLGWALSGGGGWIPTRFPIVVPMVKRLWTASFAIFAAGWTCWMLAAFYVLIEAMNWRAWSFPFVVVGMNSIAIYVMAGMFRGDARRIVDLIVPGTGGGPGYEPLPDKTRLVDLVPVVDFATWNVRFGLDLKSWYLTPLLESLLILSILWLACFWLYRRRIFFKV